MSKEECKEEQLAEIEALESIYVSELRIEDRDPRHVFTISLKSLKTNDSTRLKDAVACKIRFRYTPLYPHTAPIMELESTTLTEQQTEELLQLMNEQAEENIGMIMVFTIAAAVLDRLNELFDLNTAAREEAVEQERVLREAEERKKFEGTQCTVENFMAWKVKFDAERAAEKAMIQSKDDLRSKPSGYELFMTDKTLDESDLKFIESDDTAIVDVDESLFEDIDDLELTEEVDT